MRINDLLNDRSDLLSLGSVNSGRIAEAEQRLNLQFSPEYKSYVTEFGAVSFDGHELTGISDAPALDVVAITKEMRSFANVPDAWYVVENAQIDGIVFWQNNDGIIYRTMPCTKPQKVCNTLADYISMCK